MSHNGTVSLIPLPLRYRRVILRVFLLLVQPRLGDRVGRYAQNQVSHVMDLVVQMIEPGLIAYFGGHLRLNGTQSSYRIKQ